MKCFFKSLQLSSEINLVRKHSSTTCIVGSCSGFFNAVYLTGTVSLAENSFIEQNINFMQKTANS